MGVAGATPALGPVLTAGVAGGVGGAISMALGEYVSVSSQRDSEQSLIAKEQQELAETPAEELRELAGLYEQKGLTAATARRVAEELTAKDALGAHLEVELNIDRHDVVSPWRAAIASAVAFTLGALLPLLAIVVAPANLRVTATIAAVLLALAITGATGAYLGGSRMLRPTVRVVLGGAIAVAATYSVGSWLGAAGVM